MNRNPAYLELINSFDEPYFEVSCSGNLLLANRALRQLIGDTSGKQLFDFFVGDHKETIRAMFSRAIAKGQRQDLLLELQTLQGKPQNVVLSLSPIQEQEGGTAGNPCLRGRIDIVNEDPDTTRGLLAAKQAIEQHAKELAILNNLSSAISSSLDLDEILHSICKEMVRVFTARNTGIALLDKKKTTLKVVAFHSDHPEESDITGLEFPLKGNDASLFVIKTGEPIVIPDAQFNPITRSIHEVMVRRGTSCLLVVPLLARGDVIGTIGIPAKSKAVFSRDDVRLAQTIAGQIASVIDNARLHCTVQKARDVAERELEIGRQIQTGFFPQSLPQIPGWQILSYFKSARQVSGDFYDAFTLEQENKLAVVLADVCDKGVGAALFMVLFRSLLRAKDMHTFTEKDSKDADIHPGDALLCAIAETNNYIAVNHSQDNMFATVFAAILERDQDLLWYINCGHDAPVVIRAGGDSERLQPTNPAIGMFPDLQLASRCISLRAGDALFAFTDGVTDARAADGSSFGEEQLVTIFSEQISLQKRLDTLVAKLTRHTTGVKQYDDITCLAINRI